LAFIIRIYHDARSYECQTANLVRVFSFWQFFETPQTLLIRPLIYNQISVKCVVIYFTAEQSSSKTHC